MRDIKKPSLNAQKPVWLFLGVGYVAKALRAHLPKNAQVYGTSRDPEKWPEDLKRDITPLTFKGEITQDLIAILKRANYIVISIPPKTEGDPFLNSLTKDITALAPHVQWAAYLSATSVYGDRKGQWVFEDERLYPVNLRGRYRIEAELAWLETGLNMHVFRLAGIYGPTIYGQSRNPFKRLQSAKARAIIKDNHVVNRIYVDDIVSALMKSIERPDAGQVYNLADGHPAPPQDVLDYAAQCIHVAPPPRLDWHTANISEMARSFYRETKRVNSDRARHLLHWQPQYETYKSGLDEIVSRDFSLKKPD